MENKQIEKMKIKQGQLVVLLSPSGSPSTMLGIVKYKVKGKRRTWRVRYGYNSGLAEVDVPEKYILPIMDFSFRELLVDPPIPAGFSEMHPNEVFQKYYQKIKPRLLEIRQHLNIEVLARRLHIEDLKTLKSAE